MKSKTLIETQLKKKTNPELVKTIIAAKKKDAWNEIAKILSAPRRQKLNKNLDKINQESKEGELIIVPGKVLSQGEINKKIKIRALSFSQKAREKLSQSKSEVSTILEEIKKNPDAKAIKILK